MSVDPRSVLAAAAAASAAVDPYSQLTSAVAAPAVPAFAIRNSLPASRVTHEDDDEADSDTDVPDRDKIPALRARYDTIDHRLRAHALFKGGLLKAYRARLCMWATVTRVKEAYDITVMVGDRASARPVCAGHIGLIAFDDELYLAGFFGRTSSWVNRQSGEVWDDLAENTYVHPVHYMVPILRDFITTYLRMSGDEPFELNAVPMRVDKHTNSPRTLNDYYASLGFTETTQPSDVRNAVPMATTIQHFLRTTSHMAAWKVDFGAWSPLDQAATFPVHRTAHGEAHIGNRAA